MKRAFLAAGACWLAVMVAAAKDPHAKPSPGGDFHVDFMAGKYSGAIAGVGFHYTWKKSGQSLGMMLLDGQIGSTTVTDSFRIGCRSYRREVAVDDRSTTGAVVTYSVRVGK